MVSDYQNDLGYSHFRFKLSLCVWVAFSFYCTSTKTDANFYSEKSAEKQH